jgi:hypothetical protein
MSAFTYTIESKRDRWSRSSYRFAPFFAIEALNCFSTQNESTIQASAFMATDRIAILDVAAGSRFAICCRFHELHAMKVEHKQDKSASQANLFAQPAWRNWQTRWTQNPVAARSCGFEPLRRQNL